MEAKGLASSTNKLGGFKWSPARTIGLSRKTLLKNKSSPLASTSTLQNNIGNDTNLSNQSELSGTTSSTKTTPGENFKVQTDSYKWTPVRQIGMSRRSISKKQSSSSQITTNNDVKPKELTDTLTCKSVSALADSTNTLNSNSTSNSSSSNTSSPEKDKLKEHDIENKKKLVILLEDIYKKDKIEAERENKLSTIMEIQMQNNQMIEKLNCSEETKPRSFKRKLSLKKCHGLNESIDNAILTDHITSKEHNYSTGNTKINADKSTVDIVTLIKNKEKSIRCKTTQLQLLRSAKIIKNKHSVAEMNRLTELWKTGCIGVLRDLLQHMQMQQLDIGMAQLLKQFRISATMLNYNEFEDSFE